jgi:hypothetical protein
MPIIIAIILLPSRPRHAPAPAATAAAPPRARRDDKQQCLRHIDHQPGPPKQHKPRHYAPLVERVPVLLLVFCTSDCG